MSAVPPRTPIDTRVGSATADQTSSDKRTMVVAAVVMLALVLVGVASAALFTRSACEAIDPRPVAVGAAGTELGTVLEAAFPDADAATTAGMGQALRSLESELGAITGIAEVTGADALRATASGFAATGPTASVLDADGAAVLARADMGGGEVVGGGVTLYSLAIGNELTGQVDALLPLDERLVGLTCVDMATVGTPLGFALDADDGDALLLRVEEDGTEAELELRDPVAGRVWGPRLDLGVGQPGLLGERLHGRLGPGAAVVGFRTTPGSPLPVVTAVDRNDGAAIWSVTRDGLEGALRPDRDELVELALVDEGLAVVVLSPESEAASDAASEADDPAAIAGPAERIVVLSVDDGGVERVIDLEPGAVVQEVERAEGRMFVVVAEPEGTVRLATSSQGEPGSSATIGGTHGRLSVLDDGRAVMAATGGVVLAAGDRVSIVASGLIGRDVLAHAGGVSLLVDGPGGGSVVVTFAG